MYLICPLRQHYFCSDLGGSDGNCRLQPKLWLQWYFGIFLLFAFIGILWFPKDSSTSARKVYLFLCPERHELFTNTIVYLHAYSIKYHIFLNIFVLFLVNNDKILVFFWWVKVPILIPLQIILNCCFMT